MTTDIPQNEMQAFYEFLGRRLDHEGPCLTPEDSVREFRQYQEELRRFLSESKRGFDQARRNEGQPLDVDAIMERVATRPGEEGTTS